MRESISHLSQCRAYVFAQTTIDSVLVGSRYDRGAGVHKKRRFCKNVLQLLHGSLGGPSCKAGSQPLALDKFGTITGLSFTSALSPLQSLGTCVPDGRRYWIAELGTGTGAP